MKNKRIFGVGILLLVVLMAFGVSAFGVSSPYWKGNPLMITPGETKIVKITYQNMGDDVSDITVRAEITQGQEIASVSQRDYLVRAGTKDTTVEVKVLIPENTRIGSKYQVTLTSSSVTPGAEGGVSLGLGMDTTFDVEVVAQPPVVPEQPVQQPQTELAEENNTGLIIFACLAIIIIAIVLLIILKRKK